MKPWKSWRKIKILTFQWKNFEIWETTYWIRPKKWTRKLTKRFKDSTWIDLIKKSNLKQMMIRLGNSSWAMTTSTWMLTKITKHFVRTYRHFTKWSNKYIRRWMRCLAIRRKPQRLPKSLGNLISVYHVDQVLTETQFLDVMVGPTKAGVRSLSIMKVTINFGPVLVSKTIPNQRKSIYLSMRDQNAKTKYH